MFLCAVFFAGFTMPVARAFFVLSLVSVFWTKRGGRGVRDILTPPVWGWLAYLAVALVVSIIAASADPDPLLKPGRGLQKIGKLLWYAAIPLGAYHINTPERVKTALKTLVLGCLVTAFAVVFYNTAAAWFQMNVPHPKIPDSDLTTTQLWLRGILDLFGGDPYYGIFKWINKTYRATTFAAALAKLGTMEDSQRLMVALPAAVWLALEKYKIFNHEKHEKHESNAALKVSRFSHFSRLKNIRCFAIPAFIFIALALTCKRGPFLIGVAVSFIPLIRRAGWKTLFVPLAAVLLVALVPAARERFARLPEEFDASKGGRVTMWVKVLPELRREHPRGIGFRALTNEKMRQIAPEVEERQNHLHSVPLQSLADFGWAGLAAWAAWMALALRAAWRGAHPATGAMLAALAAYGLIEYNIADSEVVLLYAIVMAASLKKDNTKIRVCGKI